MKGSKPAPAKTRLGVALQSKRGDMSQRSADIAAGVERSTIGRIERGAHLPSFPTALKLARWLGWTVEQVMEAAGEAAELQAGPGEVEP